MFVARAEPLLSGAPLSGLGKEQSCRPCTQACSPLLVRQHQPLPRHLSGRAAGPRTLIRCRAGVALSDEDEGAGDDPSIEMARQQLTRLMNDQHITGSELRSLILGKWGRSYDARLQKRGNRTYFHIMWKYLEQRSFPMTESEYMDQLNAVAHCLTEWGTASAVRSGIDRAPLKGPGYTGGGGARAISIPLETRGRDAAFWE
ncbi:hypothetical protein WJX73_007792 [Symbiochloris irregularis]|uniref:Uncharacterized protein n=1 Tax=Symbiochloris irregularis TaxID=706552 RepID=A0AAW1PZS3_9CHLO